MPLPSESAIVTPQETLRTEPPRASEPRQQKLKIVQVKEQELSQDSHKDLDGQEFKVHKLFATLENKQQQASFDYTAPYEDTGEKTAYRPKKSQDGDTARLDSKENQS